MDDKVVDHNDHNRKQGRHRDVEEPSDDAQVSEDEPRDQSRLPTPQYCRATRDEERPQVLSIFGVYTHHLHAAYERGYAPHGYRGAGVGMGGSKKSPGKGDEVRKSYASPLGKGSPAPPLRKPESLTCRQWPFTLRGEREGLLTLSVTPAHNRG